MDRLPDATVAPGLKMGKDLSALRDRVANLEAAQQNDRSYVNDLEAYVHELKAQLDRLRELVHNQC